jgi:predicted membrane protein (TIGR00267 family)
MMAFELKLEKPKRSTAWICALIMGLSYGIGGIVPMIPYFCYTNIHHALYTSIGITVLILIVFGYAKSAIAGTSRGACVESAIQTLFVGVLAAGTSYGIVYGINKRLNGGNGVA